MPELVEGNGRNHARSSYWTEDNPQRMLASIPVHLRQAQHRRRQPRAGLSARPTPASRLHRAATPPDLIAANRYPSCPPRMSSWPKAGKRKKLEPTYGVRRRRLLPTDPGLAADVDRNTCEASAERLETLILFTPCTANPSEEVRGRRVPAVQRIARVWGCRARSLGSGGVATIQVTSAGTCAPPNRPWRVSVRGAAPLRRGRP